MAAAAVMAPVTTPQAPLQHRTACAECQRRKQKCDRQWPCNHCSKRKVGQMCRYTPPAGTAAGQKRTQGFDEDDDSNSYDSDSDVPCLEDLGYQDGPLSKSLGGIRLGKPKNVESEDWVLPGGHPQMRDALNVLPIRKKMDTIIQIFFDNVNYHYYIIYPPTFFERYGDWWQRRDEGPSRPLSIQWTSLLLSICACAIQHLGVNEKPVIEKELGESAEILSERFLDHSRELANTIPNSHYHLLNVQRMLHAIYWYKSEAKFVEAWHLISEAVREAQELGMATESANEGLDEFDQEMRRRVWCILSTWDWQFASGLGRPTIIDHRDTSVRQPKLELEELNPSPLLHMKLQAQAVAILATRFGAPREVTQPAQIREYIDILKTWMRGFPRVYATDQPDYSRDLAHPWAVSHRFYIHTMAYLMVTNPLRHYMCLKDFRASESTPEILGLREIGVEYALRNLKTTSAWTNHVHCKDGRFHFIIFSLFDTAAVMASAIIHDKEFSLPRRAELLAGVDQAWDLLRRLNNMSKTATTSFRLLARIVRDLHGDSGNKTRKKRVKVTSPEGVASNPTPEQTPTQPATGRFHNMQSTDGRAVSDPAIYTSSSTASPSNYVGTTVTPRTRSIVTPESDPPTMEPIVYAPPSAMYGHNQHMPYGAYDGLVLDHGMQPHLDHGMPQQAVTPQLMEMPPTVGLTYDGTVNMGPYAELHSITPIAIEQYAGPDLITDTELGDFNRLWDWGSLNLDFISSEAVAAGNHPPPPVTPEDQDHL